MFKKELLEKLESMPEDIEIEFSYKTSGTYSDDSFQEHSIVTEVHHNKSRNTIVLE